MKHLVLVLLSICIYAIPTTAQDLFYLTDGTILTGKANYNQTYQRYEITRPNGSIKQFSGPDIKYFYKDYEQLNKHTYLRKATQYYNTSTALSVSAVGLFVIGSAKSNKAATYGGIGVGLVAICFNIAAHQQFSRVSNLMEIELSANKLGLKINF